MVRVDQMCRALDACLQLPCIYFMNGRHLYCARILETYGLLDSSTYLLYLFLFIPIPFCTVPDYVGSISCPGGNDANAVFLSRGVWHIMNQRGADSGWNHVSSTDGARWKHQMDAINLHAPGYNLGGTS